MRPVSLALAGLASLAAGPGFSAQADGPTSSAPRQADIDRDALRWAGPPTRQFRHSATDETQPCRPAGPQWRPVSASLVHRRAGYPAPPGYRYHLFATVDLDADGRPDTLRFVDNGRSGAIRLEFGSRTKTPCLVFVGSRFLGGEGLFRAGADAVMVNYPESRVAYLYMDRGRVMARFVGD